MTTRDVPDTPESGYELLRKDRIADAIAMGERMAIDRPLDVHALVFASEAQFASGNNIAALSLLMRAIDASGGALALKIKQAGLLAHMRRRDDALAVVTEVAAQAQVRAQGQSLWQAASIATHCNRPAAAIPIYRQAEAVLGAHPGLLYDMAVAQFFTGEFADAEANLDRMLVRAPQAGHASYLRSTLRRQTPERNHIDAIRKQLDAGLERDDLRAGAWYALGKELEDLGEHDASFDAIAEGARHKRATLQYDVGAESKVLDALKAAYDEDAMQMPAAGHADASPIFVVGMPRSGTTLLERLLVHGGEVRSAGEPMDLATLIGEHTRKVLANTQGLDAAHASLQIDFEALGRDYVRGVTEAAGTSRFIDKMPVNFLYCGLILKALPNARILHLTRNPLDSCYAMFKTLFFNAYHYSYDLDEMAQYFIAYRGVMAHWHTVMPGRVLDVRYEDLVTQPDAQAKRVLEWCGLHWDADASYGDAPAARAFTSASAAQVREPVHTRSVGSAQRHRARLAPLLARFAAAGIALD